MRRYLPVLIVLLALTARFVPGPRTIDDSFITFRYARNILSNEGFVYNPNEPVLGTTTPVYTFLMVLLGALLGGPEAQFPTIALMFNALADSITCLLLLLLGYHLGSGLAGLGAALVWAIAPFSVTFSIGGLETSIYVLLLTATVATYLQNRYLLAAGLAALALLTRPDALLLIVPLIVDRLIVAHQKPDQRIDPMEVFLFLIPCLAWAVFATVQFGSLIPNSISAKTLAYRLPANAAFIRLLQHYATPFLGHLTFGSLWIRIGLVLYPFLFLIGTRVATQTNHRIWPFAIYPWLYFLAFAIANPLIFRWYLTPPLPAYILLILMGADRILSDLFRRWKQDRVQPQGPVTTSLSHVVPITVVILIPLFFSLQDWEAHPDHGIDRPAPEMAWYQLELLYREAANLLSPELEGDLTLAAGDVGVLGFYTSARILDTVGLNSPETLRYYPLSQEFYAINYAIPPTLINEQQPDFLVILEVYGRNGLLVDPLFLDNYELQKKIPTDTYGSDGMLVFARRVAQ